MAIFLRAKKVIAKKYFNILVVLLFIGGAVIRFFDFPNRLIFGPEQGMSFLTSASNLQHFSLIGETNLIRQTSANHILFHGAVYSYLILPLLIVFKFRVFPVTVCFALLNLFTAYIFFRFVLKLTNKPIAFFSLFYFLFSDVMIHHSLFAWIVNPTPLLAVLSSWLIYDLAKHKNKLLPSILIGIFSGVGFGMQNLYLPFAVVLFVLILIFSKRKFTSALFFVGGVLIGSLPTVIFDLRHDFYHVRTYWQFFLDSLHGQAMTVTTYYNYLYLYPLFFFLYGLGSFLLYRIWKPLIVVPFCFYLCTAIYSPFTRLINGRPTALDIPLNKLELTAKTIAEDNPPAKYNIAVLIDFDTRAHPLRYLLTNYYQLPPQGVEDYQNLEALYVLAPKDYDIQNPKVWELQTYLPYHTTTLGNPTLNHVLYKLTK